MQATRLNTMPVKRKRTIRPASAPTALSPALTPSERRSGLATGPTPTPFISSGQVCGFCVSPLESTLRGEMVRHTETKAPYGMCPQAIRERSGAWRGIA